MFNFIIISRNRRSLIENAIDFALSNQNIRIHLMDMGSTYKPLIQYLKQIESRASVTVTYLENLGPRRLWISQDFQRIASSANGFFLSDGDIDYSYTSTGIFEHFVNLSKKYPGIRKIGAALRIDDLPQEFSKTQKIIDSELSNWDKRRMISENLYFAPLDTQFAYYPKYTQDFFLWPSFRIAGQYQVRHAPWYTDYENLSHEEAFYIKNALKWGNAGTSHERGVRINDRNPEDLSVIKFHRLIRLLFLMTPKVGSRIISLLIRIKNKDSFLNVNLMKSL